MKQEKNSGILLGIKFVKYSSKLLAHKKKHGSTPTNVHK